MHQTLEEMKITILFFGIVTDLIGESTIAFEISNDSNVYDLKNELIETYPSLKNIHEFAIAINESYANDNSILKNGDTVAIIPPVSGG